MSMRTRRSVCVVVDGYSTATALAPVFTGYGYDTVHVRSGPDLPDVLTRSFRPDTFVERLDLEDGVDVVLDRLTAGGRRVLCVVAGAETGVRAADLLSERLGCPTNGTRLSGARRDKAEMSAVAAVAGVRTIPQLCSGVAEEILAWTAARGLEQVVLKPRSSSGTYGFHICTGPAETARTLEHLLGSRDIFGTRVDEVIVQPYVQGVEFCVNAVSSEGGHLVSDVWLTRKQRCGPANVYDLETLLRPDDPRYDVLRDFAGGVLDALGIRFGPSHTEVMLTDDGPVLIESAARFMGSLDVALVSAATGANTVLLTAEAYAAPQRFAERLARPVAAHIGHPAMVQMLSSSRGRLEHYRMDELAALPSFHGADTYLQEGDEVVPTVNSYTSPGLVFLNAATEAERDADYRRIRELEGAGALYRLCEDRPQEVERAARGSRGGERAAVVA